MRRIAGTIESRAVFTLPQVSPRQIRKAWQIQRTLGTRRAAGYLRNQDASLSVAVWLLAVTQVTYL